MLPDPIITVFDRFSVYMYGVMIAVGIMAALGVLMLCAKIKNIDPAFVDFLFYNALLSIGVGIVSAALFQAVYNYIKYPAAGFRFSLDNLTFIGGLIGGAACFLTVYGLMRRRYKERLTRILSLPPCCILIAHACGRLGCFFAGCCYGKPTDSVFGVLFPGHFQRVHPTQLYEAAFLFLLFGVCLLLYLKWNFRHGLSVYFICYGIFRFLLEYVRGDDRGKLFGALSPSQFWSVLMVGIGVGLIFFLRWIQKREVNGVENVAE